MWNFFHKLTSPPHYYRMSPGFILGFGLVGAALVLWGSYAGLFLAPIDYQQKDAFRIIYVHVPASYLSMLAYSIMAISAGIGLIWRMKMAHAVAAAAAPLGAWFTFVALATGSIWGRPMWGTWWEWGDPRLTSELLMLFLYFGYIALRSAIDDLAKAGLDGLEVYCSTHTEDDSRRFADYCSRHKLLMTSGSDYHGMSVKPNVKLADLADGSYNMFAAIRDLARTRE